VRDVSACDEAATGVAVMVASVLLQLIWPRRAYVLVLRTSSGEVDAVMSRNKEFAFNVQKAVEQSFVVRAGGRDEHGDTFRTSWHPGSDQRANQAQEFLLLWPVTGREEKGSNLNIGDLAT
jgi:hypothetical protein